MVFGISSGFMSQIRKHYDCCNIKLGYGSNKQALWCLEYHSGLWLKWASTMVLLGMPIAAMAQIGSDRTNTQIQRNLNDPSRVDFSKKHEV